jgi:hypothetical protein
MLDVKISEAITEAARAHRQPPGLADKLIRWMDDLVRDAENLDDRDAVDRRLELLYSATETEHSDGDAPPHMQEPDSE